MPQRIDVPGMGIVEFPDGMSDDQISAAIRQNMPQQQAAPAMDELADVGKSAVAGLGRGAISALGAPGDVGSMIASGAERIGVPETVRRAAGLAASALPMTRPFTGPSSSELQAKVEQHTGEFHEPQTTLGKYVGRVGEFAPAALMPGGAAARVASAVVPGVASEAAGQATEGTAAEPYARLGATLAGGLSASTLANAATRAMGSNVPTTQQLFGAADKAYNAGRATGVEYAPQAVSTLAQRIRAELLSKGVDDTVAPNTIKNLERLSDVPKSAVSSTVSQVENASKILGRIAAKPGGEESFAAGLAKRAIQDFIEKPPSGAVLRGNADEAARLFGTGRQTSAAAHRSKELDKKEIRAELRASAANSGGNVANTMRQRVADMLIKNSENPQGYKANELAQMERVVRGTATGNAARRIGNLLGGGGGLGQALVGAGAGGTAYATGDPTWLALPLAGVAGRKIHEASTMRQTKKLSEIIRGNAPNAAGIANAGRQSQPAITQQQRQALMAQLLLAMPQLTKQPNH